MKVIPGTVLKNGAEVLLSKEGKVLARWEKNFGWEFVIWSIDEEGNCFWGHYYGDDLTAAAKAFEKEVIEK